MMSGRDFASADGLGLAEAIALLRNELLKARAAGAGSDIQLPVESMAVDLTVTATDRLMAKPALRSRSWACSWVAAASASAGRCRR